MHCAYSNCSSSVKRCDAANDMVSCRMGYREQGRAEPARNFLPSVCGIVALPVARYAFEQMQALIVTVNNWQAPAQPREDVSEQSTALSTIQSNNVAMWKKAAAAKNKQARGAQRFAEKQARLKYGR
jgi:hypothetical protein